MKKDDVFYTTLDTPVGNILVAQSPKGLRSIRFAKSPKPEPPDDDWIHAEKMAGDAVEQLEDYFRGRLTLFNLPLDLNGTPFQVKVWQALQEIPYGETITYGELARWIGQPTAVRAVGGANGRNQIPIVIPCHRVIGSDGSLTGFGSGIPIKSALLEHEQRFDPKSRTSQTRRHLQKPLV